MRFFTALVAALFSFSVLSNDIGFEKGNEFQAHYLRGTFTLYCGQNSRIVNCSASYLSPSNYSKFSHPNAGEADKVILSTVTDRGRTRTKRSSMENGLSKKSFNLWIASLLQRPLLKAGENTVAYKLEKDGQEIESGEFTVNVENQPTRQCPWGSIHAPGNTDCGSGYSYCDNYFRRYNFCR